jgi:hypothetical protein
MTDNFTHSNQLGSTTCHLDGTILNRPSCLICNLPASPPDIITKVDLSDSKSSLGDLTIFDVRQELPDVQYFDQYIEFLLHWKKPSQIKAIGFEPIRLGKEKNQS